MNRRQKIIVSVTGIFLVLLLLVGLTYAYFLTKITGNENTKSISASTANLALVYGDGNGTIAPDTAIMPGDTLDSKTFTVTNEGNATTDYVVVIEDVSVTDVSTGTTTTFESNDFVYTLTCETGCNGVDIATSFPINGGILVGNSVEVGKTHSYTLTITYKDSGIDQSNDMNKTLTAKINIKDVNDISINPYSVDKSTLAYNIINNSLVLTEDEKSNGYATYATITPTKVAEEISGENESVLSTTSDEYGTSYYYRGYIENNYLNFNGMCWRIVRIEGDGAIKIVLADATAGCSTATLEKTDSAYIGTGNYGYDTNYKADYENNQNRTTSMKYKFNEWFDANLSSVSKKLKATQVCIGDTTTKYDESGLVLTATSPRYWYYDSDVRLYGKGQTANATLMCNASGGKTSETQIFPLTADEVVFAGGKAEVENYSYYLRDNATTNFWWLLSLSHFDGDDDRAFIVSALGIIKFGNGVYADSHSLRPAVSLISGIQYKSGIGTINDPYIVE